MAYGGIEIPIGFSKRSVKKMLRQIEEIENVVNQMARNLKNIPVNMINKVMPNKNLMHSTGDATSRSNERSMASGIDKIARNTTKMVRLLRIASRDASSRKLASAIDRLGSNRRVSDGGGGRGGGFIGGGFGGIGMRHIIGMSSVYGAGRLGLKSLKTASAYEEAMNRLNIALPSKSVDEMSETVRKMASRGFSLKGTAERLASATDLLKGIYSDKTDSETLKFAKQIHRNAVDLASAKNIGFERAMNAILGLMLGEPEKLKFSAGISILDEDVKEYIRKRLFEEAKGKYKSLLDKDLAIATNTLMRSKQVKADVRYHLFQKIQRRQGVEGDYERTKHLWANQFRILQENFTNLLTRLGQAMEGLLLPLLTELNNLIANSPQYINSFIEGFKKLIASIRIVSKIIFSFGKLLYNTFYYFTLGGLTSSITKFNFALSLILGTMIIWKSYRISLALIEFNSALRKFIDTLGFATKSTKIGLIISIIGIIIGLFGTLQSISAEADNFRKLQNYLDSLTKISRNMDQTTDKINKLSASIIALEVVSGHVSEKMIQNMKNLLNDRSMMAVAEAKQFLSDEKFAREKFNNPYGSSLSKGMETITTGGSNNSPRFRRNLFDRKDIVYKVVEDLIKNQIIGLDLLDIDLKNATKEEKIIDFRNSFYKEIGRSDIKTKEDGTEYVTLTEKVRPEKMKEMGLTFFGNLNKQFINSVYGKNFLEYHKLNKNQFGTKEFTDYMFYSDSKTAKSREYFKKYIAEAYPKFKGGEEEALNKIRRIMQKIGFKGGEFNFSDIRMADILKLFLEVGLRTTRKRDVTLPPKELSLQKILDRNIIKLEDEEKPKNPKLPRVRDNIFKIHIRIDHEENVNTEVLTYRGIEEMGSSEGGFEYIRNNAEVKVSYQNVSN